MKETFVLLVHKPLRVPRTKKPPKLHIGYTRGSREIPALHICTCFAMRRLTL